MSITIKNFKTGTRLRRQTGFTLLEALIGFLILSIGMMGIASLQAISLKAGKTSVYGSVAVMKVDELIESMRANPAGLTAYAGPGAIHNCMTAVCQPLDLADEDVYWWKRDLKAGLPDTADTTTVVTVVPPVAPSRMAMVTVQIDWKERNKNTGGNESVARTYAVTTGICTANPC